MFKRKNRIKISNLNTNKQKYMIIPDFICKTNKKLFVTINPKNAHKLEFSDHSCLPFIDQPQPDIVVFEIISFRIYKNLVTEWKHRISTNDIITFNEKL